MKIRPSMIITQNNRILLMKYNYSGNNVFGLPGGNPDDGETLEAALIRELAEELGVKVQVGPLLFVGEVILPDKGKITLHCIFSGEIMAGTPALNPIETTALSLEWLPLDQLSSINMYPNVGRYIDELQNKNRPDMYLGRIEQQWF